MKPHWQKIPMMRALMSPWVAVFTWVLRCLTRTASQQPWRLYGHDPLHQQHCYQPHCCQLLPSACPMWVYGCQQEALENQETGLQPSISAVCAPTTVGCDLQLPHHAKLCACSCIAGDCLKHSKAHVGLCVWTTICRSQLYWVPQKPACWPPAT